MDLNNIRQHWQSSAEEFGTDLRATTKTSSAKEIEIDALVRAMRLLVAASAGPHLNVLEVGCGNGQNCLSLAEALPETTITGVDFIEEMITAARQLQAAKGIGERLSFHVADVIDLDAAFSGYDVIITDRCLINLNSDALQHAAIRTLAGRLKDGGHLLMIENVKQTYDAQNDARALVDLPKRSPAAFNHFFDESTLFPFLPTAGLELLDVEDFISLHDLVLYVLVPMSNGGVVDYEHPLVKAATRLNIALSAETPGAVGRFGQNRFYKCRKSRTTAE